MATSSSSQQEDAGVTSNVEPKFVQDLDKKYTCPICLSVLKDAMQTVCGHRFCSNCISHVCMNRVFVKCPVDNTYFKRADEMYPDVAFQREILSLMVKCGDGHCEWTSEYRDLEAHQDSCPFSTVACEYGCDSYPLRKDLDAHHDNCDMRPVQCHHCHASIFHHTIMRHQVLECDEFPVQCSLCSQTGILRKDIKKHLDITTGQCPNVIVSCPYSKYGCEFQEKRAVLPNHKQEDVHRHLELVENIVSSQETKISALTKEHQDRLEFLKEKLVELQYTTKRLNWMSKMSFNGHLLWKVHINESVEDNAYQSEEFYTGCPGYKLHLSLKHLNQHDASIFLHLGYGEFDDDLLFPFKASCEIILLSQNNRDKQNHTVNCSSMLINRTEDGFMTNCQRLITIPTELLLDFKYCRNSTMFLDVTIKPHI